eukprot:TRINITY_DN3318_c0_g1_i3.p1 TRINITY_DN3318_c0_g1~~TRINITY_DN3318_c0_g1_i3.p1  ORF type:complete len:171 (+),score=25.10 TRINITY_DN3318_c0_g1_i3:56-568(+)
MEPDPASSPLSAPVVDSPSPPVLPYDAPVPGYSDVLIHGGLGVGKTAITVRFEADMFLDDYESGIEGHTSKGLQLRQQLRPKKTKGAAQGTTTTDPTVILNVTVMLWDARGKCGVSVASEPHKHVYPHIQGVLLVFSVTDRASYDAVPALLYICALTHSHPSVFSLPLSH